ncbi:type 4a pilus biogenesis protein PilO [Candidatus Daviesbacteria bacterium]|nr:type 4a pilus biogenesis protein PilO [Candidatus Daviesbacteria bacterium]
MKWFKESYTRHKLLIWSVGSGLASVIILTLVIIPQFLSYLQIQNQISSIKDRSSSLEVKASELESFDSSAISKDLQVVFAVLPTSQDVPKTVTVLQTLVKNAGLELKSVSFTSAGKTADKSSIQISLTVEGPINLVRNFLISLKDAPQVIQVESIGVQMQRMGGAATADLPLSIYYEDAPKNIGSLDQPLPKLTADEEKLLNQLSNIAVPLTNYLDATASSVPLGKTDPFQ